MTKTLISTARIILLILGCVSFVLMFVDTVWIALIAVAVMVSSFIAFDKLGDIRKENEDQNNYCFYVGKNMVFKGGLTHKQAEQFADQLEGKYDTPIKFKKI